MHYTYCILSLLISRDAKPRFFIPEIVDLWREDRNRSLKLKGKTSGGAWLYLATQNVSGSASVINKISVVRRGWSGS